MLLLRLNASVSWILCMLKRTKKKEFLSPQKSTSKFGDFYLLFLRMHRTIQPATTPIRHNVNTSAPTIVATKIIGCLILTTNNFRSIETAFRMITSTVNDLTFKTLCAYSRLCWHTSMVDHLAHDSSPLITYGPSMCLIQYSKFGEPLQKIFN